MIFNQTTTHTHRNPRNILRGLLRRNGENYARKRAPILCENYIDGCDPSRLISGPLYETVFRINFRLIDRAMAAGITLFRSNRRPIFV